MEKIKKIQKSGNSRQTVKIIKEAIISCENQIDK
jgi:hypothetical protein